MISEGSCDFERCRNGFLILPLPSSNPITLNASLSVNFLKCINHI